jgi:propanol-preferring alcohol dehydrogenase
VVPGHEVVGRVAALGPGTSRFIIGDRVGVAWLRSTCGACRWCRSGRENLCPAARFTGWDEDGGYADYTTVLEAYAYRIPEDVPAEQAAPLLCAGLIGYRALRRANLPPGGRLGLYGFGASAHLTAQLAIAQGAEVHVLTRGDDARELAIALGAASAGPADGLPPVPLDSSILFAPAGDATAPPRQRDHLPLRAGRHGSGRSLGWPLRRRRRPEPRAVRGPIGEEVSAYRSTRGMPLS